MTWDVHLSNKLWISGPAEAPRGSMVAMSCETDASNPKSELSWTIDGQKIERAEESVRETADGWITTSNITITLNRQVNSSIHASHINK
ncbi:ig-like domain-containing protein [Caerostris extrusa]|uniref:Ig-like domain-containing protein n=1 Tax=Caerostris extrusa TaxID=172846 RepID=A0AAV4Y3F0_CAEEX|nr:ig-like domain-containing protein [Caerostris extrusa]